MTAAGDGDATPGVRGGPNAAAGSSLAKSGGKGCSECRRKTKERACRPSTRGTAMGQPGSPRRPGGRTSG